MDTAFNSMVWLIFLVFSVSVPVGDDPSLVINELLVAPVTGVPEFVELFNAGSEPVDLSRFSLQDSRKRPVDLARHSYLLNPGDYVVLTPDSISFVVAFGTAAVIHVSPWPSLNNSGDHLELLNGDLIVDSMSYSSSQHASGLSLERIDPRVPGYLPSNWEINSSPGGATPGAVNSAYRPDTTEPRFLSAEYLDEYTIELVFSEAIDPSSVSAGSIVADGRSVMDFQFGAGFESISFTSSTVVYSVELFGLEDFAGYGPSPVSQDVAQRPGPRDIAITEIMFHPGVPASGSNTPGPEFIEIQNRSSTLLSLAGVFLGVRDGDKSFSWPLRRIGKVLTAGTIAVVYSERLAPYLLTPESMSSLILSHPRDYAGLETLMIPIDRSTLGLDNQSGSVQIVRSDSIVLDKVQYSTSWHDDRYLSTNGRSISLADPDRSGPTLYRWTTTLSPDGGSPGEVATTGIFAVEPETGALRINEIMYDPVSDNSDHRPDQPEYLEIYNASNRPVELNGLYLVKRTTERTASDSLRLSYRPTVLAPGGYALAFTLPAFVPDGDENSIRFLTESFPDFVPGSHAILLPLRSRLILSNDGAHLRINSPSGRLQDEVYYRPDWHHYLVLDGSGSSLERIDPLGSALDEANWSTSTSEYGGTPGGRNSIAITYESQDASDGLVVEPRTFHDFTRIRIAGGAPSSAFRLDIFDLSGRRIRTLSEWSFRARERSLIWDGRDDSGRPLPSGVYIILARHTGDGSRPMRDYKAAVALIR